jgi:hypothetical protein
VGSVEIDKRGENSEEDFYLCGSYELFSVKEQKFSSLIIITTNFFEQFGKHKQKFRKYRLAIQKRMFTL